jgi:hypothetical protein
MMMEASLITFLDCPAYLDDQGAERCGLPAEVEYRYLTASPDGQLESARIQCPQGHWFNGPIESLSWDKQRLPVRWGLGVPGYGMRPRTARKPGGS